MSAPWHPITALTPLGPNRRLSRQFRSSAAQGLAERGVVFELGEAIRAQGEFGLAGAVAFWCSEIGS